jgi:hypothetical protein
LVLKKIKEEKVGKIQEMIKCHVVCVFGMIKILIANLKRHTSSFRGGKIEAETVNHEMLVKFPLTNVFIPNIVWIILCLLLGVIGNSCVLFIYIFKMKQHREDR